MEAVRFGIIDYLILTLLMLLSIAIGIYYAFKGRKQNTSREFLLANRTMGVLPVAVSLLATFVSATTLLGQSSEVYLFGSQHTFLVVGCTAIFPVVAYLFLPVYYNLGITSIYEYLEKRFNKHIRTFAAVLFIIQTVLYLAIVILSPALALSQATGLYTWACSIIIVGACTIYTTIGGIRAVMWTDVLQTMVMFGVIIAIMVKGILVVGGFDVIWTTSKEGGRVEFFNTNFDPRIRHTVWTQSIGALFAWLPPYAVNQAQVQRYLASNSLRTAKNALWINAIGWFLITIISCIFGFILYTHYRDCDPLRSNMITRHDQLLPVFVMEVMGSIPGFPGLFVSALLSGSLSTLSTGLNSLAGITYEDFIKHFFIRKPLTERTAVNIIKGLAISYGVLSYFCMELVMNFTTVSEAASGIFGLVGGPILGIFILGIFFPCSNSWGAAIGMFLAFVQSTWIVIGAALTKPKYPRLPLSIEGCNLSFPENKSDYLSMFNNFSSNENTIFLNAEQNITASTEESILMPLYSISYMWYSLYSCTIVVVCGLLVSYITGRKKEHNVDPKLLSPFVRNFTQKCSHGKQTETECVQVIGFKYIQRPSDGIEKYLPSNNPPAVSINGEKFRK